MASCIVKPASAACTYGIKGNGTNGIYVDINAAPYTTFQKYSYGNNAYSTVGCAWYASARANQITGKGSTIWSGYNWYYNNYNYFGYGRGSVPREKALACYQNHVAVVEKVNGNTITLSEGGSTYYSDYSHGYCVIRNMSRSEVESSRGGAFLGYVYLNGAGSSSQSTKMNWGNFDCQTDTGNAFIYTKATPGFKGTYTQAGANIWDAAGNKVASKTENINTYSSYLEVWYNITNEMGVKLKSGMNYKYQYWVIFNGQKYLSPMMSFTTKGVPAISAVTLSQTAYTFDNKVKTPSVTVMTEAGKLGSSNYTVSYPSGRKAVGKYDVKVTFKGNYSGSKTVSFTINPKAVGISKISPAKKSMTVKWAKPSSTYRKQMTGYQIRYSTSSSMTNAKVATIKSNAAKSKKISSLKSKTRYYVQMRTYKTVKGVNYYSGWSQAKSAVAK